MDVDVVYVMYYGYDALNAYVHMYTCHHEAIYNIILYLL